MRFSVRSSNVFGALGDIDAVVEPSTTYWTEWYSSENGSGSFHFNYKQDFNHLCTEVLASQCRDKYTHDTRNNCYGAVMRCYQEYQGCRDEEIRLQCRSTNETLPGSDLHWSLSELDSGGTQGAVESWSCDDAVTTVEPVVGNIWAEVMQGGMLSQTYGPPSHDNLCGVQTNGSASLVFRPYVHNCLTSPDCCNSEHGITVMFWLRRRGGNHSNPQTSPYHVLQSPTLVVTVEQGLLWVKYLHGNTEWNVNVTLAENQWTHVTITFDRLNNLTMYLNGEAEGVASSLTTSLSSGQNYGEFRNENTSFKVFSTELGVTPSNYRPLAMTDLKIFFSALTANLVNGTFFSERQGAPPKIMRMSVSRRTFRSSITDEHIHHVKLTCLIRSHDEIAQDDIHFLYKTSGESFKEMTSEYFYMMTSLREENEYHKIAVAHVYGIRSDSSLEWIFQPSSPSLFTCEVTTTSQLSVYGYETIATRAAIDLDDDSRYYWTEFYDNDHGNGGNEEETLTSHLDLVSAKQPELPCQNPTYAECITKSDPLQWYEVSHPFVPDPDYSCEGQGIRCTMDHEGNQQCPDLEVRYACPLHDAIMSGGAENNVTTPSMHHDGTQSQNESSETDTREHTTEAPDTPLTSPTTAIHDRTPSGGGDAGSVTKRNEPNNNDVTYEPGAHDRTPFFSSPVSTSAASSPDASTTRQAPDTSTSASTTPDGDTSSSDVSTTSRSADTKPAPDETRAPDGAKDSSENTGVITRRTDHGLSTVSDTVTTPDDTSRTTKPTVARSSGDDGSSSKATGNRKITITGNDSAHLNYLYPVMIVALGAGIPTLTACYYLCRKLTPEEIEERRLIEERKRKLDEEKKPTKP